MVSAASTNTLALKYCLFKCYITMKMKRSAVCRTCSAFPGAGDFLIQSGKMRSSQLPKATATGKFSCMLLLLTKLTPMH